MYQDHFGEKASNIKGMMMKGMTAQEIAKELDVDVGFVRQRINDIDHDMNGDIPEY